MAVPVHFAYPFRWTTSGRAVVVEQESPQEMQACVAAILSYPTGFRAEAPDFGVPEQNFRQNGANLDEIRNAVEEWEDRVDQLTDQELEDAVASVRVMIGPRGG